MTQTAQRRALRIIFLILLMDITGITILFPIAAYIVTRYSSDALMITMMTVIYSAAQFFAAPVLGKLGDRLGRRPVLLASVFGSAIGYLIFGLGGALWILFVARLIDGITGGNISVATAYIADISEPETRAKNFGLVGVAWGVGLIVGPAIGAALGQIMLEAPAFLAAGVSLVSVVLGYFYLPESLPPEQRETAPIRLNDLNPFVSIGGMWRRPGLGSLLLVLCLFNFAFNSINSTQTIFLIEKFDAQPWQTGVMLVLAGITVIIVQAGLVQRVVQRYGERWVTAVSLIGQGIVVVMIFFVPLFTPIYLLNLVNVGLSTFTFATITALTANAVTTREQGSMMGVTTALTSLMTIFGPLWGGLVYDHIMPGAPFWLGAVIYGAAAVMTRSVRASNDVPSYQET